ncbi:glutathione peroxidase [Anaeroplasma bactoclasticum]|jgi:glutathione peroxidase|uniref:Glutathione peroxidase n=1 Tax=Anaeroplasma bactoclasticum TaxID=2088 RepID=A0A397RX73_9MOLU|nr:glutathione peroxidase [Anaeroplasma bactoclasticum]RIA77862.1 glutathione peroxidase [Anaeroplasma bactoclasticum]
MTIYDIKVVDNKGEEKTLEEYKGKVLLIVNTATHCGFTPQYKGLEELYLKYKDLGFLVLDFPCNQFAHQAPESDSEINSFCEMRYKTTFPRFKKIDVNGKNEHELYKYMKNFNDGKFKGNIKWNFSKFLIDREGNVVGRFGSLKSPKKLEESIEKVLK